LEEYLKLFFNACKDKQKVKTLSNDYRHVHKKIFIMIPRQEGSEKAKY